jgi:hypothetical protein
MNTIESNTETARAAALPGRHVPETPAAPAPDPEIIAIHDPDVDVREIVRQIRANMAVRQKLPPLAAALGRARLADERKKLRQAYDSLQERIAVYGIVETHLSGWLGTLAIAFKKTLRKLINRHLHQQQLVNERLMLLFDQILQYLDDQDQCLRVCLEQAERRDSEARSSAPERQSPRTGSTA